ncbi:MULTISPECIES: hypothetical protein [unclassified Agrobacterium]|uniref:hypothetical protein n=1 Tax=unclassified Agrobacterium TaxID=2632611 RepID=UPI00037A440C|nr:MULTISPECIES: hypothetical protein [unclassified Agrobacterium]SNB83286.1 hypothetical protein SAMN05661103_0715 [Agrobacterium sp. 719_389]
MAIGASLLFGALLIPGYNELINLSVAIAGLFLIMTGGGVELLTYLQQSKDERDGNGDIGEGSNSEVSNLKLAVESLSREYKSGLSEQERVALKNDAIKLISGDLQESLATYWKKQFQKAEEELSGKKVLRQSAANSRIRLKREISDLGRRANVNLTIGALISFSGIIFLSYSVYLANDDLSGDVDLVRIGLKFIARLSVVILVQVFAYFFLRLYRYSLYEIKYFQNELTNADIRFSALYSVICFADKASVTSVAKLLAQTERNFVLKKGESTINLRREELETAQEATVLAVLERLTAKAGSQASSARKSE